MYATFADPKTDFIFKRIFGAEERKPLLLALLNDLLELEGSRRILEVQHMSPDQHVDVPELKLSIVDVKCTDATGRRFVIEMQVLNVEGFEKRVVYNASKAYVMQLQASEKYPELCDVVGITICNFLLWPEKDPSGNYNVPMLSRWRMQEQRSGEKGLSQVQYTFLELPKYKAGDAPKTLVDKWAYFFLEAKNLEVIPPSLSEAPFRNALEVARRATFTYWEWEAYDRAKMAEQDARGALVVALREGRQEGRQEGLREGLREGEERGHRRGSLAGKRETLLQVAAEVGIPLSPEDRARIESCEDAETLTRWTLNALRATTAAELLR